MSSKKIIFLLPLLILAVLNLPAQTPDCICPGIKMTEPESPVKAGATVDFAVEVKGWKGSVTYNWSVSAGTIVAGQGTPAIRVATNASETGGLTATVEVRGDWCPACENTTVGGTMFFEIPNNPVLVDKFVRGNCEVMLERLDYFFSALQNDPAAQGYLIINGKRDAVRAAETETGNWIKGRGFDPVRLTIVRGGAGGPKAEIEMWLVPPGAAPPEITAAGANTESEEKEEIIAAPTKPFVFTYQTADGIDGCKPFFDLRGFAEILKRNTRARGNIVIFEAGVKAFRQTEREILGELLKNSVARKRLRAFFVKVKPNALAERVELWLLP